MKHGTKLQANQSCILTNRNVRRISYQELFLLLLQFNFLIKDFSLHKINKTW